MLRLHANAAGALRLAASAHAVTGLRAMPSHYVSTVLLTRDQIQDRIVELAADIERDTRDDSVIHLVGVLKGGFMILADLARAMGERVTMDFIAVSSYGKDTKTSGEVRLLKDLDHSIEGRDVMIVEDIVDTGLTLTYLQDILRARAPHRLRSTCLLNKPSRRLVDVRIDYVGFDIDDQFVVGYGLDYDERYRNLPYIGILGLRD